MNSVLSLKPTSTSGPIKLKLTVAYDGANYQGWQVQPSGPTVQQHVEQVLQHLFPGVQRIHGSSRTDTGVHALGMVAHVEIPQAQFRMPVRKLPLAMNAFLPEDIRIVDAKRVPLSFHARFDSSGKRYRYQIWNHRSANPILRHLTWHVPVKLDQTAMKEAAGHFVGKQDFRSLAANRDYEMEDTVRTLFRCDVRASGPLVSVVMEGDGFLYKMCRSIVGTLCLVGHHKLRPAEIPPLLAKKAREFAGMTAPAHGLTLVKVFYQKPKKSTAEDN